MVLVLAVPQAVDLVGNLHPLGNRRHSLAPPPPPLRLPTPLLAAAASAKVQAMVDISLPHDGRQVVLIPFLHVREVVLTYSLMFSGGPRPGSDGEWTPSWRGAESPPAAAGRRRRRRSGFQVRSRRRRSSFQVRRSCRRRRYRLDFRVQV